MRRISVLLAAGLAAALAVPGLASADPADPRPAPANTAKPADRHDNQLSPLQQEQQSLRKKAVESITSGGQNLRSAAGKSVRVGRKYVELEQERKDRIFVVLAEFGDQVDNETMVNGQVKYGGTPGPRHNQIPKPDKRKDNHTLWKPDFSRSSYQGMYFDDRSGANSLRNFYQVQSSGRYDMDGYVSDWVRVPFNESRYGSDRCTESGICHNNWDLVRDSVNTWYTGELARGRSAQDVKAQLQTFDVWDRYDYDNDGDFNEPDGYLDHYQVVHAGIDETWGGGAQGADAVWAHRYFAYWNQRGTAGPSGNKQGGTQIGDTGIWVGDYLTAGENSGVGLTAHEFGHDLGLPDLYASAGDNAVGYWSLMSSGSYLGSKNGPTGEYAGDLDAWSKLQLGWLNYERAGAATASKHTLGVSSYNTKDPQAVLVDLPKRVVSTELVDPVQGSYQWWSGRGDYLNETLTRQIDLTGLTTAELTAKVWYQIEDGYDFLYPEASIDGGKTWQAVPGTVGGTPFTTGITGTSGWNDLVLPLTAYAGKKIDFRFRYSTDTNTSENGFLVDAIGGVVQDDVESGDNGWTAVGFSRIGKVGVKSHSRAYLVENRRYAGYNTYLKTGPYNFGWRSDPAKTDLVEHYPYQEGVLVWLWDTYRTDNTTRDHPGEGMILPIDARPTPLTWTDLTLLNGRAQVFDAPFSRAGSDRVELHKNGVATVIRSQPGVRSFDDHSGVYWSAANPDLGVKVPDTNTRITVLNDGARATVQVGPAS